MSRLRHLRSLCALTFASLAISGAGEHPLLFAAPQKGAPKKAVTSHRHATGFTFETPSDWRVEDRDGNMLLLPPEGASPHEIYVASVDPAYSDVRDPRIALQLEQAVTLLAAQPKRTKVAEPLDPRSTVVLYAFDGSNAETGAPVRIQFFLTAAHERLLVLMAIGSPDRLASREPDLRRIASSLAYTTAETSSVRATPAPRVASAEPKGLTDDSATAKHWAQRLSGKLMTQMSSYSSGSAGGYSSKTTILLATDGTFTQQSSSSVSIDASGASGNSGGAGRASGRWYIYRAEDGSPVLRLLFDGQSDYGHNVIEDRNGQTFINGGRWFVTDPK